MNIAQLHIYQQPGLIAIQQDLGGMVIKQPQAEQEIRTEHVQVQIERRRGGLQIDQSKAWAAVGLMKTRELRSKIYSQVQQIALQAIARYVQDGNRLAAIHQPGDALVELAKESSQRGLTPLDYTGPARYDNVDIDYVPDQLFISFSGGQAHIHTQPQKPIMKHIPAQTEIRMKQYPSIRFEVTGTKLDRRM